MLSYLPMALSKYSFFYYADIPFTLSLITLACVDHSVTGTVISGGDTLSSSTMCSHHFYSLFLYATRSWRYYSFITALRKSLSWKKNTA